MADRLLDTNAVSAGMRFHEDFLRFLGQLDEETLLFTSSIVEGEILFGLSRLPEGRKKRSLSGAFSEFRASLQEVVPVTAATAARYAIVKRGVWSRGRPLGENDLWIAATALEYGLVLVTSDSHFAAVAGLDLENWAAK